MSLDDLMMVEVDSNDAVQDCCNPKVKNQRMIEGRLLTLKKVL